MKIILASQGFTTNEIEKGISEIVGKPASEINIAIINESAYRLDKSKSKRWLIQELANIEKHIGGKIDFIDFFRQTKQEIKERLLNVDLIYIVGGKQHIYSEVFYQTDTIEVIREIAQKKVVMGTSAGSIVLGKQIESEKFWKERYHLTLEDIKYKDLGIVPFNIIPHFMRKDRSNWTKEFFKTTLADNPFTVYGITDEQAIAYIDGKIKYIGGEPEIFGKM